VSITVRNMSRLNLVRSVLAVCLLVLCTSCAEFEQATLSATEAARNSLYPQGAKGRPKIVVSLGAQRAYLYKGKTMVGESTISTGKPGFETPPGSYRVIQKDADHVSSIYGDYVDKNGRVVKSNVSTREDRAPKGSRFVGARMPYFLRFNGGYGMHAGYVPRYRASHGCIRMPTNMAKRFFNIAQLNTPVIVRR